MTPLEEKMLKAIDPLMEITPAGIAAVEADDDNEYYMMAKMAAEVARIYIEKAFHANPALRVQEMCGTVTEEELKTEWLKENGVI